MLLVTQTEQATAVAAVVVVVVTGLLVDQALETQKVLTPAEVELEAPAVVMVVAVAQTLAVALVGTLTKQQQTAEAVVLELL